MLQHIVEGLCDAGIRDCLIVVGLALMLCRMRRRFALATSQFSIKRKQCKMDGRVVELAHDFVTDRPFIWPMAIFG